MQKSLPSHMCTQVHMNLQTHKCPASCLHAPFTWVSTCILCMLTHMLLIALATYSTRVLYKQYLYLLIVLMLSAQLCAYRPCYPYPCLRTPLHTHFQLTSLANIQVMGRLGGVANGTSQCSVMTSSTRAHMSCTGSIDRHVSLHLLMHLEKGLCSCVTACAHCGDGYPCNLGRSCVFMVGPAGMPTCEK